MNGPLDVLTISDGLKGPIGCEVIRPERITKKRVRNGNPCFDISWTSVDGNSKFLPKNFESCEPSAYVRSAYPQLVADFEDSLSAKAKPKKTKAAGTGSRKPKSAVATSTETQASITNFFTQSKVTTLPSKSLQSERAKLPAKSKPEPDVKLLPDKPEQVLSTQPRAEPVPNLKLKQSKIKPTQRVLPKPDLVLKKNMFAHSLPEKCNSVPPSPILMHREVLKIRGELSRINDMSVDVTNDSFGSDLSMIIDDFIGIRKPDSKENKVPSISAPVSTSTPQCHKTRESVQNKVFKKIEPFQNCGNQVPKKPSPSKNVRPFKQNLATNPFSKQMPTKSVFNFKSVDKFDNAEKDISMAALDESLPKLDKPRRAPMSNGIDNYLPKKIEASKNADKDMSMMSLNGTLEDSFDRMCK